ncbi:aminoglycoside adenylyltransferase domain-containing protein [Brevibacillus fluminis]|uniref:aminoglycoside adenylyltransferase domain-containing protein n=1 Tax=Brevibacillus fluminis TaxID=511487 RepID=UPI003F896F4D
MKNELPKSISHVVQTYAEQLRELLPQKLVGVYLYGSISLGGYEEGKSDIDFVAILTMELATAECLAIGELHRKLTDELPLAAKLDGVYVTEADVGKTNAELRPYPYCAEGVFHASGHWDLNHVTWWLLHHHGLTIAGKDRAALAIGGSWGDVMATMQDNLTRYWAHKSSQLQLFLEDEWVEFAVLTMCRIYDTITRQRIVTKTKAAEEALAALPQRWHPLIKEALRLRHSYEGSQAPMNRMERAMETCAFIRELIPICQSRLV